MSITNINTTTRELRAIMQGRVVLRGDFNGTTQPSAFADDLAYLYGELQLRKLPSPFARIFATEDYVRRFN